MGSQDGMILVGKRGGSTARRGHTATEDAIAYFGARETKTHKMIPTVNISISDDAMQRIGWGRETRLALYKTKSRFYLMKDDKEGVLPTRSNSKTKRMYVRFSGLDIENLPLSKIQIKNKESVALIGKVHTTPGDEGIEFPEDSAQAR